MVEDLEGGTQEEREQVRMCASRDVGEAGGNGPGQRGQEVGARTWGWLPGRGNRGLQDPP